MSNTPVKKIVARRHRKPKNNRNHDQVKALRQRVAEINDYLPGNYMKVIIKHYPEYDTKLERIRISNIKRLVSTDLEITQIFEDIFNRKLS